jgi:hypothetical protein
MDKTSNRVKFLIFTNIFDVLFKKVGNFTESDCEVGWWAQGGPNK